MSILNQLNTDLAGVTHQAQSALVAIENGRGHGAGTIWQSDGLIVTNAHVVDGANRLNLLLPNGERVPAQVLARSSTHDLAALMVDAHDLPTIPVGDSRDLQPGDWVMAVGHPWGVRGAATHGVVVSPIGALPEIRTQTDDWLAMSLHLRPGHSGGAVVNTAGELVGINTLMAGPEVGVAVPSHVAVSFVKEMVSELNRRVPRPRSPEGFV